jgi:WG containing repeat
MKSYLGLLLIILLTGCSTGQITSTSQPLPATTAAASLAEDPFRFVRDRKFGYIDRTGQIVIPAKFERADDFSEGLASVEIDKKSGCIDRTGKLVIPAKYEYIYPFENGLAKVVNLDRSEATIVGEASPLGNHTGQIVPSPKSLIKADWQQFGQNGKYGYTRPDGSVAIPAQYDFSADMFSEDRAWVMIGKLGYGERIGYINRQGKAITPPRFDYLAGVGTGNFHGGLARVCEKSKCGYIDKNGKVVIPLKFDDAAQKFSDGLAWVKIGDRLGYIDRTGKVVIQPQFRFRAKGKAGSELGVTYCAGGSYCFGATNNFDRGLAAVEIPALLGSSYGYIDKTGKLIFKF